MTRSINRIFWTVIALLALLFLLPAQAQAAADSEAAADRVTIANDGTVTVSSSHMAGEEVSSMQLKLRVGDADAEFAFDSGLDDRITYSSCKDGVLSIYIAGTEPLMTGNETELTVGKITGVSSMDTVETVEGSLEYVYGTRVVAQTFADVYNSTGGESITGRLDQALRIVGELLEKSELYTEESVDALRRAGDDAYTVMESGGASDEELETVLAALQNAINGLKYIGEAELESVLEEAVEKAADSSKYTPESYAALQAAIEKARKALVDRAEDTDWNAAIEALEAAIEGLELLDSGTTDPGATDPAASPDPNASPDPSASAKPGAGTAAGDRAPGTGDETAVLPWVLMLCLSGAALTVLCLRRSRSRR